MKDINFREITKDMKMPLVEMETEEAKRLNETIKADSEFLKKHNIMDYSLLLVIENIPLDQEIDFNRVPI